MQVGLAAAPEGELTVWVNLPDHCTCLGTDEHAIRVHLVAAVTPAQDGDFVEFTLAKDGEVPWREVGEINENPCLCSEPEHLDGGHLLAPFPPRTACNVDLLSL